MRASHVSFATVVISGLVLFLLGLGWAVMRRARDDLRKTKAAVKALRKGFWGSLWTVIKVGTLALIGLILLVVWNVRDFQADHPSTVDANISSPSATPSR